MGEVRVRAPDPPLGDDVVSLRMLSPDDGPAFLAGLRDPEVARFAYADRLPADVKAVRDYIDRVPERLATGKAVLLAVVDAADGEFLGKTMLFRIDAEARSAEIGFWLSPRARGRGLAARAIRLTVGWAFEELGLERLQGLTDVDNLSAQRVMELAGFVREGILRGFDRCSTGRVDAVSYSRLNTDELRG